MPQLTFIDPAGKFITTLDDPNDPRLRKSTRKLRDDIEEWLKQGEDKTITADPRLFVPGEKWETLQLPTTDNCHLLCAHCVRTQKALRPDVSFDAFKKFLSNFTPDMCRALLLSDFGEPFLRKDILDILRYVKSQGFLDVALVSTGILLTEKIARTLVEERLLSKLLLSTEGATPEGYEAIRGADFATFSANVKTLSDLNAAANYPIFMELTTACFKDNLHELPGIMDLAHRLNIDSVLYVHLNPVTYAMQTEMPGKYPNKVCTPDQHLDNCDPQAVRKVFRDIHKKSLQYGIDYSPPEATLLGLTGDPPQTAECKDAKPGGKTGCLQFYRWVQVNYQGNVYPCCQISKNYSMGNLHERSFWEIWHGEVFSKFRDDLQNGNPNEFCRKCNVYNGKKF